MIIELMLIPCVGMAGNQQTGLSFKPLAVATTDLSLSEYCLVQNMNS